MRIRQRPNGNWELADIHNDIYVLYPTRLRGNPIDVVLVRRAAEPVQAELHVEAIDVEDVVFG